MFDSSEELDEDTLVPIARFSVAALELAVDARVVSDIGNTDTDVPQGAIDAGEVVGVRWVPPSKRRLLRLERGGQRVQLVIGETVTLERVATQMFRTVPPFIAGVARQAAIAGFILNDRTLICVLDSHEILDRHAAPRGDG